ncbi:lysosome-associated membrane glycoprotein 3 [Oenanthe melanoleuca]|uniref:lysosome-associated membrane glycoprotein 3 n=1 Tax=Oenanthe melanoleuca TaxID=2939378 RepID=UPI0024C20669|nr:lysosome-associated membrane glycoprotein 3 [Oenanthe melanoleuca]
MGRSARQLVSLTLACAFSSCFAEVALGVELPSETTSFHQMATSAQSLSLYHSPPHQSTTVHFNSTGPLQATPTSHRTTEKTTEQLQAASAPGQHAAAQAGAGSESTTPTDSPSTATAPAVPSGSAAGRSTTTPAVSSTRRPGVTTGTAAAATNSSLQLQTASSPGAAASSTHGAGPSSTHGAGPSTTHSAGPSTTHSAGPSNASAASTTHGAGPSSTHSAGPSTTHSTGPSNASATSTTHRARPSTCSRRQTTATGVPTATANSTATHTGTHTAPTSPASTVRPPPTPQPSDIPTGTYTLSDGNSTCVKAVMGLQLMARNTQQEQMEYVTVNPNATKISGSCGMVQSELSLTFSGGFVNITFVKQATSYSVTKIESRIQLSSEGMFYYAALNEKLFTTKLGNSFKCVSRQTFTLERNFQILFVHVQLQAFDIVGNQFGKEEECFADRNSKIAPIAVCLCILGLFVIVFATFLISRRKPHRGYERI